MIRKVILFLFLIQISYKGSAQFVQGFGVTIGATESNQRWRLYSDDMMRQRYKLSFNASVFAEMFKHETFRWVTEIEYNRKGARMRYPIDDKSPIRANYLSWNNFLKVRQELYDITTYWYIGPKAEYLLSGQPAAGMSPELYRKIHVTGATGVGIEFLYKDPWIFFLDLQWNPDIMHSYVSKGVLLEPIFTGHLPERIRHNAYELKVGIKYKPKPKRTTCPAYVDPA